MSVDRRVINAATLLAFLAVGSILYFAATAFVPVVLALFFALLTFAGSRWPAALARAARAADYSQDRAADPASALGHGPSRCRQATVRSARAGPARGCSAITAAELGGYFGTIAVINLGLGLATAAAMAAFGMPNAHLWGTVAAVLNFIPFLGPVTMLAGLAVAALVTFNSVGQALAVPSAFRGLHLVESQLGQPLFVGHRLDVSALVILLAVWFGFSFWGVPGVALAVPLFVALKVASEHLEGWHAVREFLSPNPQWRPIKITRPDGSTSKMRVVLAARASSSA
jgi:predicted PurR-regulated permease PerM